MALRLRDYKRPLRRQGQGIGDIQQNNTVNITVTGEQVADGTLAADVESQVFGALSSVLDRAGRSLS